MSITWRAQNVIEKEALIGETARAKIYSSINLFPNEHTANLEFSNSKAKLFLVNTWSNITGITDTSFSLHNETGHPLPQLYPKIGDFIRIDLSELLLIYWLKVTSVDEQEDVAQIILKPAHHPTTAGDKIETKHFFNEHALSIFRVERNGKEITATHVGINKGLSNVDEQAGRKCNIHPLAVDGAWAGFTKHQWKKLTDYLAGI